VALDEPFAPVDLASDEAVATTDPPAVGDPVAAPAGPVPVAGGPVVDRLRSRVAQLRASVRSDGVAASAVRSARFARRQLGRRLRP
jgi:hypothetical protein